MNEVNCTIKQKKPAKSFIAWTWPIIIAFFSLSIINLRFALLGFLCMMAPIGLALSGKGKRHCSHYCPRGSFFGKIISRASINGNMPKFMDTKIFKYVLLVFMFTMFGISLFKTGLDWNKIASVMFRMMLISFIIGSLMGVFFKPRSWCKVCPMGNMSGIIRDALNRK